MSKTKTYRLKMYVADTLTDEGLTYPITTWMIIGNDTPKMTTRELLHGMLDKIIEKWEKENEND